MIRRAFSVVTVFLLACAGTGEHRGDFDAAGGGECRVVDSILAGSGWREPVDMTGAVTFDVKQYRVKGRFRLTAPGDGDLVFEFTGTMAMGGHHEDVVVSLYRDTLRVLDRERGRYYEGAGANALVSEGLDLGLDAAELLRRITGRSPPCARLSSLSVSRRGGSGTRLDGRIDGKRFRMEFEDGRVTEATWPIIVAGREEDRLRVNYDWTVGSSGSNRAYLKELVAFLEGRRWRVKLNAN
jgi:hypothetical protein